MYGLKLANLRTRLLTGRGAGRQAFGSNANSQSAGREAETGGGGLLRRSGEVLLTTHARFTDGTLEANLSKTALEKAAKTLLGVGELENDNSQAAMVARHVVEVMLPGHPLCSPGQGNVGWTPIPVEFDPEYTEPVVGQNKYAMAKHFETIEGIPVRPG